MPATYTKRIMAGQGTRERANSTPCPAGKIWVLRCLDVVAGSANATTVQVAISPTGVYLLEASVGGAGASHHFQWTGRQVVQAGEHVAIIGTDVIYYSLTGYELAA